MVASHGRYDCIWPLGAVTLDCVKTVAFEGTADEMWPQTVDGRAEAAAVNAMASGSQHRTMSAGWPQIPVRQPRPALFGPSGPPLVPRRAWRALRPSCTPAAAAPRRA